MVYAQIFSTRFKIRTLRRQVCKLLLLDNKLTITLFLRKKSFIASQILNTYIGQNKRY